MLSAVTHSVWVCGTNVIPWTPPPAHPAVGPKPQVTCANGDAARVVRFGLHLVQHFSRLPVDLEHLLRYLVADPQTVGRSFERIGMNVGRLVQPLDFCWTRGKRRRFAAFLLRARHRSLRHPGDQRRCGPEELSTFDVHNHLIAGWSQSLAQL